MRGRDRATPLNLYELNDMLNHWAWSQNPWEYHNTRAQLLPLTASHSQWLHWAALLEDARIRQLFESRIRPSAELRINHIGLKVPDELTAAAGQRGVEIPTGTVTGMSIAFSAPSPMPIDESMSHPLSFGRIPRDVAIYLTKWLLKELYVSRVVQTANNLGRRISQAGVMGYTESGREKRGSGLTAMQFKAVAFEFLPATSEKDKHIISSATRKGPTREQVFSTGKLDEDAVGNLSNRALMHTIGEAVSIGYLLWSASGKSNAPSKPQFTLNDF